jgi:hypothetical protein
MPSRFRKVILSFRSNPCDGCQVFIAKINKLLLLFILETNSFLFQGKILVPDDFFPEKILGKSVFWYNFN